VVAVGGDPGSDEEPWEWPTGIAQRTLGKTNWV